jgi:hypothetical protein
MNRQKIPARFYTNTYEMAQIHKLNFEQVNTHRKVLKKLKPQRVVGMSPTVYKLEPRIRSRPSNSVGSKLLPIKGS